MTNKEKLVEVNNKLDNWQGLSLLEHFDLVLKKLPEVFEAAKNRPDDEFRESDFEKGLLDNHDLNFDEKLYTYGI
jgi:hypothetical protein